MRKIWTNGAVEKGLVWGGILFIRTFIKAKTLEAAHNYLNDMLSLAEQLNIKLTVTNIEPYWKFDDSFQIEMSGTELSKEQMGEFLGGIASKWDKFTDSYLATESIEGCEIFLKNFELIEVFYEIT